MIVGRNGIKHTNARYTGDEMPPNTFLMRSSREKMTNEIFKSQAMFMTMNDKKSYGKSSECCICEKRFFGDDKNRKVRDHCRLTGREALHTYCNLQLS